MPNTAYEEEEDVQRWPVQLFAPKLMDVEDRESETRLVRKTEPHWERERSVREEQDMLCTTFVP